MKYLKYLLGLLLLLILLFIGKGILSPQITYGSEVTVNKPIEEAWAVMSDESKASQWLKGITEIEPISGKRGTVGAVTKYTFNDNGQESIVMETIKEIRPNEYMSMDFEMEGVMNMDYNINFSEKNGKTIVKSSTIAEGEGFIMRSLVSFMKGTMQAQEDENMNNLKSLIDGNTTNYFPAVQAVE
jgi:uncharacterized protein YndB with AHSA1/START domain